MKKLLSLLLILIMLTVNAAATGYPTFNDYTDEQLLTAYTDLMQTLRVRGIYPYTALEKGDKGNEVIMLQTRLAELGYYTQPIADNYGSNTINAMKAFEKAAGLKQDGKASVEDQKKLFAPDAPEKGISKKTSDASDETTSTQMVWVSKTGSKYHKKSSCSNMKNPSKVSLETAKSRGLTKCKICW